MKKMLSRLFLAMMIFNVTAFSAVAETPVEDLFDDVDESHENFDAIDYLASNGIVEGYGDGSFKPSSKINRAEFLKILLEAADYEESDLTGEDCYSDVQDQWFAKYVCTATEAGYVMGYPDGTFRAGQAINFAEASKIIANVMELKQPAGAEEDFDYWYQPYVVALEVWEAVPTSIPSFSYEIDRGEMSEMVYRVKDADNLGYVDSKTYREIHNGVLAASSGGELQEFESCAEITDHIELNSGYYYELYNDLDGKGYFDIEPMAGIAEEDFVMAEEMESEGSADLGAVSESKSASEASSTNVQVAGVDEADIVKNDLEYIYVIQDFKVQIVKAYPAEEMEVVSELTFGNDDFYPSEMYVDGDRLVVVGQVYGSIEEVMPEPMPLEDSLEKAIYGGSYGWEQLTMVYVVDISDRSEPEVIRDLVFEGGYTNSRKVDDTVYLVLDKDEYYYDYERGDDVVLPMIYDSAEAELMPIADCGDVSYYPGVQKTDYLILAAIPVGEADAEIDKEVIMGASGTVYSSRENLYVAEANYDWFIWESSFDDYGLDEETIIHKFALGEGSVEYETKGSVPGSILNQFSMDEDDGYFRVATTVGDTWNGTATNNLYILNEEMNEVGKVENIAPGEDIYSVRFMGDRAYMVTFLKVDPFFVIDVSDPSNPAILGELKIPGYSDYLHPFGDDYIIGFGKDTVVADEDEWWGSPFAWYQGLKIAMFDVTDVQNPKELHKVIIGDRGTDSEVLYDHKALLFDANKGLMALPVKVHKLADEVKESTLEGWEYGDFEWQGAYVYDVSAEDGFQLRGKIKHYEEDDIEASAYYYYGYDYVKRILYIGDMLYTVSFNYVKANDLETLEDVNDVVMAAG